MAVRNLLPVKEKDDKWVFPTAPIADENDISDDQEIPANRNKNQVSKPKSFLQLYANEQKSLNLIKNKIALLCSSVVEDPENNMNSLKELINMLQKPSTKMIVSEKKLLSLSLLQVFTDILPGYKIRTNIEADKKIKLKKETKRLLNYELSLLRYYKKYLDCLQSMINNMKSKRALKQLSVIKKKAYQAIGVVAVKCLCELLPERYFFNYYKTIINIIVPLVASKQSLISSMSSKAIQKLYKADKLGEASLEAVKQTVKVIKERNFYVPEELIKTFLSLNLQEVKNDTLSKKADMKKIRKQLNTMSRKEKKYKKKMHELELQLRETEAQESKETKSKLQTEMLKKVFWVYFHILKDDGKVKLVKAALEGLSKFAHLINLEFYEDLSAVLCSLMENENLTDVEKLHCMNTIFVILSGQAESLNIDPQNLYCHLYNIILNLQNDISYEQFLTTLKCLDVMVIKRKKKITFNRILAFVKRLCTVCLQTPIHYNLALLCIVRTLMISHGKCDILLDTENSVGSGIFLPELRDPEYSNASSTSLWELNLLSRHYYPLVAIYARHLLYGCPMQGRISLSEKLTKLSSEQVLEKFADVITNSVFDVEQCKNIKKASSLSVNANDFLKQFLFLAKDDNCIRKKSGNVTRTLEEMQDIDEVLTWKNVKRIKFSTCLYEE